MFNYEQYLGLAKLCGLSLLYNEKIDSDYLFAIKNLSNLCKVKPSDSEITQLFKNYIICGGTQNTINRCHNRFKQEEMVEALTFGQSNDTTITIIAKLLYYNNNRKKNPFLKLQIDRLIYAGFVNIKELYIQYLSENNYSEREINLCLEKHKFI